jgi:hypothetical protein
MSGSEKDEAEKTYFYRNGNSDMSHNRIHLKSI